MAFHSQVGLLLVYNIFVSLADGVLGIHGHTKMFLYAKINCPFDEYERCFLTISKYRVTTIHDTLSDGSGLLPWFHICHQIQTSTIHNRKINACGECSMAIHCLLDLIPDTYFFQNILYFHHLYIGLQSFQLYFILFALCFIVMNVLFSTF